MDDVIERMTFEDFIERELEEQTRSDVVSGVINPTPVFELIELKGFGIDKTEDLEVPAYAREVVQNYL